MWLQPNFGETLQLLPQIKLPSESKQRPSDFSDKKIVPSFVENPSLSNLRAPPGFSDSKILISTRYCPDLIPAMDLTLAAWPCGSALDNEPSPESLTLE